MGKPIVMTRTAAAPDFVVHGRHGFLTRAGDAAELASSLQRLLTDQELAISFGENARNDVLRDCSLSAYAARLLAAIDKMAGKHE